MLLCEKIIRRFAQKSTAISATKTKPEGEVRIRTKPKTFFEFLQQNKDLTRAQIRWNDVLKQGHTSAPNEPQLDVYENFLYGFRKEDFVGRNSLVKRALSTANATDKQLLSFKKQSAMSKFQRDLTDTGSKEVQIACMTEQIIYNVGHCIKNNKDFNAKRKLKQLMFRRERMLNLLRKENPNHYIWVVREFNIQQSQKKLEAFNAVDKDHKRSAKMRKKFMYKSINRDGWRIKDIKKIWNLKKVKSQKID